MYPLKHLILVSGPEPAGQERRLLTFAASMGVTTKIVSIRDGSAFMQSIRDEFQPGTYCLAISAKTLASMNNASISATDRQSFINECPALLVFECTSSTEQLSSISRLTSGAVSGINALGDQTARFAFPPEAMLFSRQFAGLSFSGVQAEPIFTFELPNATAAGEVIMTANEQPIFVRMTQGPCDVFLLSAPLPDIDSPLSFHHGIDEHYDRLIPALIFLRHCFRETCWHGPESTARVIIDDPVLSEHYGFLNYSALMKSMERNRYGTSVAFIPWNHWRTSRRNVARLLGDSSGLAICIHGCDHTNKEFVAQDPELLGRKAGLALQRMESQRKRTGAAFEQIMVFPQGLFSTAAIPALRANNYLAAVNTTCFPTNSGPQDLKLRDLLRPAVTQYDGFPIFLRRYPRRIFDFAFDLFLGRPLLLGEHPEYFRDGCGVLEEFVAELYKIEPTLSWPSLTTQLMRSCLKRSVSGGSVEVQFFTRRFQLCNDHAGTCRFSLSKNEPDPAGIERVLVDGASMPFSVENGFLKLEVEADAGQARNIEIVDREHHQQRALGFGVVHNTGVLLRRGLSEFRDTTLMRHDGLLRVAKGFARALKVTGDT